MEEPASYEKQKKGRGAKKEDKRQGPNQATGVQAAKQGEKRIRGFNPSYWRHQIEMQDTKKLSLEKGKRRYPTKPLGHGLRKRQDPFADGYNLDTLFREPKTVTTTYTSKEGLEGLKS